jgi:NTP pyrophosphatase (non-canonical NTP hydrolase)
MQINYGDMVATLAKPGDDILASLTPLKCHLWHMASCIPGEAGELFDAVKKHVIYNKPMDRLNVVEELGDLEFYMEGLRQGLGITREETLAANVAKLGERYKGLKYSDKAAQERADKVSDRSFIGQQQLASTPMQAPQALAGLHMPPPAAAVPSDMPQMPAPFPHAPSFAPAPAPQIPSAAPPTGWDAPPPIQTVPPSAPQGEQINVAAIGKTGELSHIHTTSLGAFVAYDEGAQELGRFVTLNEAVVAVRNHNVALNTAKDATTQGTQAFEAVAAKVAMGSISEVTYLLNAADNPFETGTVGYNNFRAAFLAAGTAHIGG